MPWKVKSKNTTQFPDLCNEWTHLAPLVLVSNLVLEQAGDGVAGPAELVLPGPPGHGPAGHHGSQRTTCMTTTWIINGKMKSQHGILNN